MVEVDEVSRLVDRALKSMSSSHRSSSQSFHSLNESIIGAGKVKASNVNTNGMVKDKTWTNDNTKLEKAINNSALYNPSVSLAPPLKEPKPLGIIIIIITVTIPTLINL